MGYYYSASMYGEMSFGKNNEKRVYTYGSDFPVKSIKKGNE
jgi:hypothetical protein